MRAVRKWRSIRVRNYVLPVLLGALALRFLIPTGHMMESGDGTTLSAAMCSTGSKPAGDKKETIEIPGEPAKPHCDNCLMPPLGPARAPFNVAGVSPLLQRSFLPQLESQIPEAPLVRAQIPRAPPRA
jgi:hypothetical protein